MNAMTPRICALTLLAAGGAACPAWAQPPDDPFATPRALAAGFTSEKLWIWQTRLELNDWHISVTLARAADLKPDTWGTVRWDVGRKTAVIRVLDPADYRLPPHAMLQDMEFTIVHELIHLALAPAASDLLCSRANRSEEEQAVNRMATALLELDRNRATVPANAAHSPANPEHTSPPTPR